ncbi:Mycocerosic acid synthase-like polyketide synthase [Seminavis robusta]|uniref:Fatty acid synthase n=1 Tax=Seminavis robusta TaxID=568900 RepID=A0A9N8DKM6_9STRA|nr:Mycocerosic acid synthase-like polyketide synthase [Seminavis robusta]|eukprot:Sro180_g078830.1 Mycocerosic acid synthase-like polyketide synthase (2400) ;mRNA; r:67003-74593
MTKICVGGLSLRLPQSANKEEFWQHLLQGGDLVTEEQRNWAPGDFGVPARYGKLCDYDKFDSSFFDIHPKQASKLDPQVRMLLEVSYEAMLDAGINPAELSGSNTGVFVGTCGSDVMANNANALDSVSGYEATGCALSMFANRVSHHFNLKGPSLAVDTACSSALTAFDLAVQMIENGQCERAIVGGANFIFHPLWTVCFNRLNMLSPDGKCKSFNEGADGFARSEGIVAILLTREDLAVKKYARVVASGCNSDGFTEQGITYPNQESQQMLLRRIYGKDGVDPNSIAFAETHGTGTKAGDPVELGAMEQVLFEEQGRTAPLLVGSVKSNMGHAEGASGLAGIAKVLLSMQHGVVPSNLHAENPKGSISGLRSGRFRINDSLSQFESGLASISSFGFGGSNAHVVLEMIHENPTKESAEKIETAEWLAFPYSSRTQEGLERLGDEIMAAGHDPVVSTFLTRLNAQPLRKQPYRGMIFCTREENVRVQVVDNSAEPRPVWFVCNGVGSQWSNMGQALPKIPATRELLSRCAAHLSQHGIDLDRLLYSLDKDLWCPTNIFVAVLVVQLAQVEALRLLNVTPSGFFGHSLGELVCAYLDGAISLEQTLDIAFFRGQALVEAKLEPGAMAAVQTDRATLETLLLEGIEIACHNGTQSFTVSGPAARISRFAEQVKNAGIPCAIVDCGGIPFHHSSIQRTRPAFARHLKKIIQTPQARSGKWQSSSRQYLHLRPSDDADIEYFIDNLVKPVHFFRCLDQVPTGAIIVELGPCGLLRSQCYAGAPESPHISLAKRNVPSSEKFWRGLAELGCRKGGLDWQALLGKSTGVENPSAHLKELVHWDHHKTWELPEIKWGKGTATDHVEDWTIDINDPENAFVKDHIVNSNPIFPGVGYLHLVWLTLAKAQRKDPLKLPVEFKDIRFVRASIFRNTSTIKLSVKIDSLQNTFTVTEGVQLVAEGKIASTDSASLDKQRFSLSWMDADTNRNLQRDDVYRLFVRTGIEYGNLFRGISQVSADRKHAALDFTHNWPTFFDATLQLLFVGSANEAIGVPRSIGSFRFDPRCLPENHKNIPASIESSNGSVRTPVVEIEDVAIHSNYSPPRDEVALHKVDFKAFIAQSEFDNETQEYVAVCRNMLFSQLYRILRQEDLSAFKDATHLRKIESALLRTDQIEMDPPTQALLEKFISQPRSHMLRLICHLFERWQELVHDAMPLILSHPEYTSSYRDDRVFKNRPEILENMLELVVQNSNGVLRTIEIGAGSGALTSTALPYLSKYAVSYEISDVSAGYFGDLAKEFQIYSAKSKYVVWDANEPAPAGDASYDLILASNAVHTVRNIGHTLKHIAQGLKKGGFFLIEEMTGDFWFSLGLWGFIRDFWTFDDERVCGMYLDREGWIRAAREVGLELAMSHEIGGSLSYLLFRKVEQKQVSTIEFSPVVKPSDLVELQHSLQARSPNETLWLLGDTTSSPGLDGFVRCLAQESGQKVRGLCVDGTRMPESNELERLQALDLVSNVVRNEQSGTYMRSEFCQQRDKRGIPADTNFQLRVISPGDLGSIRRVPDWTMDCSSPKADVKCFPLNFKDAMLASGRISSRTYKPFGESIGLEYAGELKDGTRVMGLNLSNLGISPRVPVDRLETFWTIPPSMSFEAACTIPVAYATAFEGIVLKGRARRSQSIFIHSGAGAVGQAAIWISLDLGLEIFTTVGSDSKRAFLLDRFPNLKESHILDSRSNYFKSQLLKLTNGRGVDIVLNSFSGERLLKSVEALAKYGHFIDISRYDAFENHQLPMKHFLKNITYSSIALDEMYHDQHEDIFIIHEYIQDALDKGVIQPISHSPADGVRSAVEELLRGDTIGKLILNMSACQSSIEALNIFHCRPDKQYLVTGGLGGVGIEFCQWLLSRGAQRITIATRSSNLTAYQQLKVSEWRAQGAQIDVTDAKLSDPGIAEEVVRSLEQQMSIGGVFHLAMTLRDDLFSNFQFADFELPIQVKVSIGDALDRASRKHCSSLDHFVVFSSAIAFYGNEGQSNYAYANSTLERLCEQRHRDGLPSVAIQWGALGNVGFVAREKMENSFAHLGLKAMSLPSLLDSLDSLLLSQAPVVSAYAPLELAQAKACGEGTRSLLSDVLQIVGFEQAPEDEDHTLADLGVDSLMIVEINQILSRDYGLTLAPKQIRELTLSNIRKMESDTNKPGPKSSPPTATHLLEQAPTHQSCKRALFYFDGMFLDPKLNLERAKLDPETAYIPVPYHHPDCDLDQLTDKILQQALRFAQNNVPIEFFGFSFGGIVASVVQQTLQEELPAVVVTCAALPRCIYNGKEMAEVIPLVNSLSGQEHVSTIDEAIAALLTTTKASDVAARRGVLEGLQSCINFQAEGLSRDVRVVEAKHDSGVVMQTLLGNQTKNGVHEALA